MTTKTARKPAPETIEAEAIVEKVKTPDDVLQAMEANAVAILSPGENALTFADVLGELKASLAGHQPDTSTAAGRDKIRALARKVASTKVMLVNEGKKLTEEWREKTKAVNAVRGEVEESLDALSKAVRQPLTLWEEREARRQEACKKTIEQIGRDAVVTIDDTAATVTERLLSITAMAIDATLFSGFEQQANAARTQAIQTLSAGVERLKKEEAERAERERERAELDALRKQNEERIAREAADRAEKERAAAEAQAAAEQEQKDRAAAAQAEVEAANRRAVEAEANARRQIEEQQAAERAETERRERNKKHAAKIMGEAKVAIMDVAREFYENRDIEGGLEAAAVAIVTAIRKELVPHVSIKF